MPVILRYRRREGSLNMVPVQPTKLTMPKGFGCHLRLSVSSHLVYKEGVLTSGFILDFTARHGKSRCFDSIRIQLHHGNPALYPLLWVYIVDFH